MAAESPQSKIKMYTTLLWGSLVWYDMWNGSIFLRRVIHHTWLFGFGRFDHNWFFLYPWPTKNMKDKRTSDMRVRRQTKRKNRETEKTIGTQLPNWTKHWHVEKQHMHTWSVDSDFASRSRIRPSNNGNLYISTWLCEFPTRPIFILVVFAVLYAAKSMCGGADH